MKVIMMTDLEGVAGVVSFTEQSYPEGKYYEQAKKLLTAEVNAAVEGALQAGADDILVVDGHGCGAIVFEELHPEAKLMHGRPLPPRATYAAILASYDVAVMIGQHAMAGTANGNQNHSQSSRTIDSIKLNGQTIGEIAQFALYCGGLNLPMIFLSGDDAACREAESLIPGIHTTTVKQGLSRQCAISFSAARARRAIREGMQRAIEQQANNPIAPLTWEGPYILEKRFFHTHVADREMDRVGFERVDSQTVRVRSDEILEIVYR